jgi:hypothetical protein
MSTPDILAHVYDAPAEMFTSMPGFEAGLVSPAAVYLAHDSCPLNGEVLVAGGGQVLRLALLESQGLTSDALTPEVIAENIDQVLDLTDAQVMTVGVLLADDEASAQH